MGIASSYPQFRMAMVLTLITFASVSLCQYTGTCGSTGSAQVYGARLLSVMAGCSVPVLLSQLILPWCVGANGVGWGAVVAAVLGVGWGWGWWGWGW